MYGFTSDDLFLWFLNFAYGGFLAYLVWGARGVDVIFCIIVVIIALYMLCLGTAQKYLFSVKEKELV